MKSSCFRKGAAAASIQASTNEPAFYVLMQALQPICWSKTRTLIRARLHTWPGARPRAPVPPAPAPWPACAQQGSYG